MRYYHHTDLATAEEILENGFVDAECSLCSAHVFRGVWVTDREMLGMNEADKALLAVDVDDPNECARINIFEWTEETEPYRKWFVPARLLNLVGSCSIVERIEPAR